LDLKKLQIKSLQLRDSAGVSPDFAKRTTTEKAMGFSQRRKISTTSALSARTATYCEGESYGDYQPTASREQFAAFNSFMGLSDGMLRVISMFSIIFIRENRSW
jgi:hypothetical protein